MAVAVGGSAVLSGLFPGAAFAAEEVTLPSGVKYIVKKQGNGPKPEIGELCAIRFAAFAGSNKIDDIFETPEPYYTRVGSGGLLKGVESTLPLMRVGDRWELTVPVSTCCSYETFVGHHLLIGHSITGWDVNSTYCLVPLTLHLEFSIESISKQTGKPCFWPQGSSRFGRQT